MLKALEYWLLCNLGAVAIILVGVNVWLYAGNRSIQAKLNARAQYIQQTGSVNEIHQQMANALAELAIKNHDQQLEELLKQQGFTISPRPTVGKPATAPAPGGKP